MCDPGIRAVAPFHGSSRPSPVARLIWSNTAFQDEALYLRAGHLEWAQWLHQTPIPNFPRISPGHRFSTRRLARSPTA